MSPGPPTTGAAMVGTARARELRRLVGPTAWAVLEDLAADARPEVDRLVAYTNVRRLADNLGLSKDTAARSLRRLLTAGLITRVEEPRGENGTFGRATYVLEVRAVEVLGQADAGRPPAPAPAANSSSPRQRQSLKHDAPALQAALFEVDPAPECR
ncbi:MAG: MarR family transcriptional regulator [Actinobacteria bacterium]|nr:MarR family transcriptional regulator [Actinomycetota bacterium]